MISASFCKQELLACVKVTSVKFALGCQTYFLEDKVYITYAVIQCLHSYFEMNSPLILIRYILSFMCSIVTT